MEKEVNNVLRISITNKCNFNCIYCPDYMEVFEPVPDNSIELTNDEIIKIVQDVTSLGIKKVSLTWWEPLMLLSFQDQYLTVHLTWVHMVYRQYTFFGI